jgi:hypothetical protein
LPRNGSDISTHLTIVEYQRLYMLQYNYRKKNHAYCVKVCHTTKIRSPEVNDSVIPHTSEFRTVLRLVSLMTWVERKQEYLAVAKFWTI